MHLLRSGKIFKSVSQINLSSNTEISVINNFEVENNSLITNNNSQEDNCDNDFHSLTSNSSEDCFQGFENYSFEMAQALNIGLALKIVPEFNGECSRDLDRFVSCCEMVLSDLKDGEEIKFIKLLHSKLTGKAHDVLLYNKFEIFDELKTELVSQFGETKSVESLNFELISLRQDRNEDVRSYANRVEKLLSLIDSASIKREGLEAAKAIRNLNAGTALRSFEEGLREPIRLVIKASRYKTLKEAINGALEEEIIVSQRRSLNPSNSNNNNNPQSQIKCNYCNKTGHTTNNCFKRQQSNQNSNSSNLNFNRFKSEPTRSNNDTRNNKYCNYCKTVGHLIDDCRKRQYNNSHKVYQNSNRSNTNRPTENSKPSETHQPSTSGIRVDKLERGAPQ